MFDSIPVRHSDIFNLCSSIHTAISTRSSLLDIAHKHHELYIGYILEAAIHDLQIILEEALAFAPDDVRDFFLHYEEMQTACPF